MRDNKINRIITFGIPFIFGVGAGWIVQGRHWDVFLTSYVPALATLVAAFYGARYAFQFQKDKEKEDIKKRNVVNGNSVIFNMMRMTTTLRNIQRQIIDPARDRLARFLQMRPTLHLIDDEIKLNIDSLYFLLETDERNILGKLVTEEARYRAALNAINERSRLHRDEIQPLLERARIVEGGDYSLAEIEKALGNRLYITIQQATEQAINHVDNTVVSLTQVADKLRNSLKKTYPDEIIIGFEITL
ncbi:MAG TPA: hypothetical protein DD713_00195 [Nitrospiraceae bacterium]|nr:hypothetical protein [Nitrospiraceae bacterium]